MTIARMCAAFVVFAAGCGESSGTSIPAEASSASSTDTNVATSTAEVAPSVPELRGLTFAAAQTQLSQLDLTWRWIVIQGVPSEKQKVCRQEPAPGATDDTQVTLGLADNCDMDLPTLTGMTVANATKLLDTRKIDWALLDGVDIDFPESLDDAPPGWHVCDGDVTYAVDDAISFLSGGESYSGMLYGDGESVVVFLHVAPEAGACYTTNDGEPP